MKKLYVILGIILLFMIVFIFIKGSPIPYEKIDQELNFQDIVNKSPDTKQL